MQPGSLRWPTERAHYKNFYDVEGDPKPLEITGPGWYVAVNRFAPNEDQPRIRACVITPTESEDGFIGSNQTSETATTTTGPSGTTSCTREGRTSRPTETLFPYLIRGKLVHVEGSIETRRWRRDGREARRTVIDATTVRLLTGSQPSDE